MYPQDNRFRSWSAIRQSQRSKLTSNMWMNVLDPSLFQSVDAKIEQIVDSVWDEFCTHRAENGL
jgi:hypothetical protein